MHFRILPFLYFLCNAIPALAQSPTVISVSPANQTCLAAPNTDLVATFDSPIDPTSVSSAAFKVFGKWSGPAAGNFNIENNGKTIRFSPTAPFFAGETVSVYINKKMKSLSGEFITKGHFWQFVIKTKPGILNQPLIDVIPLRLPSEVWIETYGAYAGDLNNDAWGDLVAVNEKSDDLRILLNDGTGKYPHSGFPIVPMGAGSPSPNEPGDFNGDGEIDLVVTTAHHNETRVLFGDGLGNLAAPVIYTTGMDTRAVAVLDFEFDGDDDILTGNRSASNLNLLSNAGDGTFTVAAINPVGNGESALAVVDANNDGFPDFFLGFFDAKKIALFLGDGAGNFTLSDEKTVTGQPWMMAAGDWNGDGLADVASANSSCDCTVVLYGQPGGTLSQPTVLMPPAHQFSIAADAGDLDGDGDLDLVISNYNSVNYTVFENDGAGNFSVGTVLSAQQNASCAILHDRDNDGDLDITGSDETSDALLFFENTGASSIKNNPIAQPISMRIFPNPSQSGDPITLEIDDPSLHSDITATVFNSLGQLVLNVALTQTLIADNQVVILPKMNLPAGTYRIQINTDSGAVLTTQKWVVIPHQ